MTDNELLQVIYNDMQSLKQDVQSLKQDSQEMKQDIQILKQDVQTLKQDTHTLKQDTQELKQRTSNLEYKVTGIRLILENEIHVNIQRVAEGHLDLSRNLHETMKPNNEVEMLTIKVRRLESDMKEMKHKVL